MVLITDEKGIIFYKNRGPNRDTKILTCIMAPILIKENYCFFNMVTFLMALCRKVCISTHCPPKPSLRRRLTQRHKTAFTRETCKTAILKINQFYQLWPGMPLENFWYLDSDSNFS